MSAQECSFLRRVATTDNLTNNKSHSDPESSKSQCENASRKSHCENSYTILFHSNGGGKMVKDLVSQPISDNSCVPEAINEGKTDNIKAENEKLPDELQKEKSKIVEEEEEIVPTTITTEFQIESRLTNIVRVSLFTRKKPHLYIL